MKKQLRVSGIILLLFILLLGGCTNNANNPAAKFYGTWKTVGSFSDNETWVFYQNGTVKNTQFQVLDEVPLTSTAWFKYEVKDNNLCLSSIEVSPESPSNYSECFSYEFFEDADRVTLSFDGTVAMIFARAS